MPRKNEIRVLDLPDKVWDVVSTHAVKGKRSRNKQVHIMLEEHIDQNKIKPIKSK